MTRFILIIAVVCAVLFGSVAFQWQDWLEAVTDESINTFVAFEYTDEQGNVVQQGYFEYLAHIWRTDMVQGDGGTILDGFLDTDFAEYTFGSVSKTVLSLKLTGNYLQWVFNFVKTIEPWDYTAPLETYEWGIA